MKKNIKKSKSTFLKKATLAATIPAALFSMTQAHAGRYADNPSLYPNKDDFPFEVTSTKATGSAVWNLCQGAGNALWDATKTGLSSAKQGGALCTKGVVKAFMAPLQIAAHPLDWSPLTHAYGDIFSGIGQIACAPLHGAWHFMKENPKTTAAIGTTLLAGAYLYHKYNNPDETLTKTAFSGLQTAGDSIAKTIKQHATSENFKAAYTTLNNLVCAIPGYVGSGFTQTANYLKEQVPTNNLAQTISKAFGYAGTGITAVTPYTLPITMLSKTQEIYKKYKTGHAVHKQLKNADAMIGVKVPAN